MNNNPFNDMFGDWFGKFGGLKDTKESVTKLYIEGRITKTEFLERMKKIDEGNK